MALTYVIKARAQREIERAAEWWGQNRAAAPGAVRRDIEDALGVLILQPGIGSKVETGRTLQIRRFLSLRTRYWIYYRVRGSVLEVLSVWHSSRGRGPSV